jgi:ribosome-binding protein aMBF1 (putative translation factor)
MSMNYAPLPSTPVTDDLRCCWARLFGLFVESAREKTGRSTEETAVRIGMTVEDWQEVEAGRLLPNTREQVYVLADAVDVEWSEMVEIVRLCRNAWGLV